MSKSDSSGHDIFLFDDWVVHEFNRSGGFTALLVLIRIATLSVIPLRSAYVHVIGDETRWAEMSKLLAGAGVVWDGVLVQPVSGDDGGPVSGRSAAHVA